MADPSRDPESAHIEQIGDRSIHTGGGMYVEGNVYVADDAYDVRGLENPYLGLRSFTFEHRDRFAGRAASVEQAVSSLTRPGEQTTLMFVIGASGCGKSSFVQAGMLPALEAHYRVLSKPVRHTVITPSRQPMAMLAEGLYKLGLAPDGPSATSVFASVQGYSLGKPNEPAATDQVSLLVIDQFEEVFSQSLPEQREQFLALLTTLPSFAALRMHIIVTFRVDYLPDLHDYEALFALAKSGFDLRKMTADELTEAIWQPMRARFPTGEKRLEDALVDALVRDAGKDATFLPLLQVTLEDLWRRGQMRLSAYGALTDAIRLRAESIYLHAQDVHGNQIERSEAERAEILAIMLDLIDVSLDDEKRRDVRRRRPLADIVQANVQRRRLVDELSLSRLLSVDRERQAGTVEVVDIIHDSLIANWDRLQNEIEAQRERLRKRARFEHSLAEWQAHGNVDGFLLTGVWLKAAQELQAADDVSLRDAAALDYLRRSQRHRFRLRAGVGVAALVVACVIGLMAWRIFFFDPLVAPPMDANAFNVVVADFAPVGVESVADQRMVQDAIDAGAAMALNLVGYLQDNQEAIESQMHKPLNILTPDRILRVDMTPSQTQLQVDWLDTPVSLDEVNAKAFIYGELRFVSAETWQLTPVFDLRSRVMEDGAIDALGVEGLGAPISLRVETEGEVQRVSEILQRRINTALVIYRGLDAYHSGSVENLQLSEQILCSSAQRPDAEEIYANLEPSSVQKKIREVGESELKNR
ncbi:MAG: hypothetical protein R2873_19510 [Caldilineaceae bacterium]